MPATWHELTVGNDASDDEDDYVGPAVSAAPVFGSYGWLFEIEWRNDGTFEDLSADVIGCSGKRGRSSSSLTSRFEAGTLEIRLRNITGKYSYFNTSSPLYGFLDPGPRVRVRMTFPFNHVLWTGRLTEIIPTAGGIPTATLRATGSFSFIGPQWGTKISPAAIENTETGSIIGAILDAVSWPTTKRVIDSDGIEIHRWYVQDIYALEAIQDIEETELGAFFEGRDFDFVFQSRYYRHLHELSSVMTLSDDPADAYYYRSGIQQLNPQSDIFNLAEATISQPDVTAQSVSQTLTSPIIVPPSSSVTIIVPMPGTGLFMRSWNTPTVVSTGGTLSLVTTEGALRQVIQFVNSHVSAPVYITSVTVSGSQIVKLAEIKVRTEDTASQSRRGIRSYPLPGKWYGNAAYAEGALAYFVSQAKDPHPRLIIGLEAYSMLILQRMLTGAISRRITVKATKLKTQLGINGDFYIESIAFSIPPRGPFVMEWELSPASADPNYFVLDENTINSAAVLAY